MFKTLKRKIVKPLALTIMFALLLCTIGINSVHAEDNNISIAAERSIDKAEIIVNETITSNYSIIPQPIPCDLVNPKPEKEIILVIDTSGSMNNDIYGVPTNIIEKRRITIAKKAAQKFIDSIDANDNVKIALASYANVAAIDYSLTSRLGNVRDKINYLEAVGGTNIGDGLRRAYYELNKAGTSSTAKKYIIMLTDGEPTYHSYDKNKGKAFFFMDSGMAKKYDGGGNYSMPRDIEYCYKVINELINTKNIMTYMVAFTSSSNGNVMDDLANAAGGVYKAAIDSTALNKVYEDISEDIAKDYIVSSVKFEEEFPEGLEIVSLPGEDFTVSGQKVTANIGDICYNYNNTTNQYEAEPINFEIGLKGTAAGVYILGENYSSKLNYKGVNWENCCEYFSESQVSVIPFGTTEPEPQEPFGMPELKIESIERTGETIKIGLNITLPEHTDYGQIRDNNNDSLDGYDSITASGVYYLEGLSIYETHIVKLWAKGISGEENETDEYTIFKAIDIN